MLKGKQEWHNVRLTIQYDSTIYIQHIFQECVALSVYSSRQNVLHPQEDVTQGVQRKKMGETISVLSQRDLSAQCLCRKNKLNKETDVFYLETCDFYIHESTQEIH
jgi:hypothetical protein